MSWRHELDAWASATRPSRWARLFGQKAGHRFRFAIGEPADERAIGELEDVRKAALPPSFRRFLKQDTANIAFWWSVDKPRVLPDGDPAPSWGNFELNLEGLSTLAERCEDWVESEGAEVRGRWQRSWPVLHVPNGDMLALDMGANRDEPPIIYLNHEMPDAIWLVSPSWDRFLEDWCRLGCVGPEVWELERFCQKRGEPFSASPAELPQYLDSRYPNGRAFRSHFGLEP